MLIYIWWCVVQEERCRRSTCRSLSRELWGVLLAATTVARIPSTASKPCYCTKTGARVQRQRPTPKLRESRPAATPWSGIPEQHKRLLLNDICLIWKQWTRLDTLIWNCILCDYFRLLPSWAIPLSVLWTYTVDTELATIVTYHFFHLMPSWAGRICTARNSGSEC